MLAEDGWLRLLSVDYRQLISLHWVHRRVSVVCIFVITFVSWRPRRSTCFTQDLLIMMMMMDYRKQTVVRNTSCLGVIVLFCRNLLPICRYSTVSTVRHQRSTLGRRAFSVAGPIVWNSLPDELRDDIEDSCFRQPLKSENTAFQPVLVCPAHYGCTYTRQCAI